MGQGSSDQCPVPSHIKMQISFAGLHGRHSKAAEAQILSAEMSDVSGRFRRFHSSNLEETSLTVGWMYLYLRRSTTEVGEKGRM